MDLTQEQVDALEAAKVVRPKGGLTTERIMELEMDIKRTAVRQVRRFFYGPTLAPKLRDQALHFVSFGTIIKYDWLMSDERHWNRPGHERRISLVGRERVMYPGDTHR